MNGKQLREFHDEILGVQGLERQGNNRDILKFDTRVTGKLQFHTSLEKRASRKGLISATVVCPAAFAKGSLVPVA